MSSRHRSCPVACLAVLLLAGAPVGTVVGQGIAVDELREQCELAWRSLQTLHFTSNEYNRIGDRLDHGGGSNRIEFWQAPGGKRAMVAHAVHPDHEELIEAFRQDGRRRYTATSFEGHPDAIRDVTIQEQPDSEDRYEGTMNGVLWLLMPAGKPVHVHLEEGARVVAGEGAPGDGRIALISEHRGQPLRIVIDPGRDWLPVEVAQEGRFHFVATEFKQDNGRWFPVAGRMEGARGSGTESSGFEVVAFQVNRPIPPSRFAMPAVEAGVPVVDLTGKMDRTRIEGGAAALKARAERYSDEPVGPSNHPPIVVPHRNANMVYYGLFAAGVGILIAAAILQIRRRNQGG